MAGFRRLDTIVHDCSHPDLDAFLQNAYWHRDKAYELGFTDDRFETFAFGYLQTLEIARHRYFLSLENGGRHVSFDEAIDSFYDCGYAVGFHEHWRLHGPRTLKQYRAILRATSIEAAHAVVGDYDALTPDGRVVNKLVVDMSSTVLTSKERAA